MSLASPRTTNNQAEYLGLVTGLAAADRHRWRPLSVVGDSQLIINHLQLYRPPKNSTLRRFYASARRLADGLGVTRWSHHLRAFNKAADAAANIAMDTRRSIQTQHSTDRPEWAGLDQLSTGDFIHWQASVLGGR
jgi:ribonuclease HI